MSSPVDPELPTVGELLELVEQLDADNERLRMKSLDLMRLMEDAVTAQVAGERRIAELTDRVAVLDAELEAIARTRLMRLTAPLRSVYRRLRSRGDVDG